MAKMENILSFSLWWLWRPIPC